MTVRELWPRPSGELFGEDLVERYPRGDRPVLRVNFVSSIDGAVTVNGFSAGLSGPGDELIFGTLRMVCDALVVGAGTIRTEKYDALRLDPDRRAWRRAHGLSEYPLMVIVSRVLDLDPEQDIFSNAPIRPLIVTPADAPSGRRAVIGRVAEIITYGEGDVDLAAAVAELHARGAGHLLCEGGPHLLGALAAADLVDEMCLTVSPLLAGGDAGRIATGAPGSPRSMSLRHILAEDDMLFLKYARTK